MSGEEKNVSFCITKYFVLLYTENLAVSDPKLQSPNYHFLDRSERYSEAVRKAVYLINRTEELGLTDPLDLMNFKQ